MREREPSGWTRNYWNSKTGGMGTNLGTYYGPSAVASQTFSLGGPGQWGTIALEISRGV